MHWTFLRRHGIDWPLIGWSTLFILGAAFVFGMFIWFAMQVGKECASRGGHMISSTGIGTGISTTGSLVTTTNTVQFCVSEDGRILF